MSRLASVAAAFALTAAVACSDGNGPEATGNRILVLRSDAGRQSIWEYAGTTSRRLSPESVPLIPTMARAADGRLAYVGVHPAASGATYELVELSADQRVLRRVVLGRVTPDATHHRDLAYSPDGTRLGWHSVRSDGSDSLYVLDAGATSVRGIAARAAEQTVDGRMTAAAPFRWTPSGRLVFGPAGSLLAHQAAGNDTLVLTTGAGEIRDYDFTADGRLAIVSSVPLQATARLRAQRVPGGALIQVPGSAESDPTHVRWSMDGQRLATTAVDSMLAGSQWVRFWVAQLVEPDGSAPALRVPDIAVAALHGWSGDGRIVLTGVANGTGALSTDVFAATFGGTAENVTRTRTANESAAIVVR